MTTCKYDCLTLHLLLQQAGYKVTDMAINEQTRAVHSSQASDAIKAYRQEPAETDFSATPLLLASDEPLQATSKAGTADVLTATGGQGAPQPALALSTQDTEQEAAVLSTVPLSEVPIGVQQLLTSDTSHMSQAQASFVSSPPVSFNSTAVPLQQSSPLKPIHANQQQAPGEAAQGSVPSQSQMHVISAACMLPDLPTAVHSLEQRQPPHLVSHSKLKGFSMAVWLRTWVSNNLVKRISIVWTRP